MYNKFRSMNYKVMIIVSLIITMIALMTLPLALSGSNQINLDSNGLDPLQSVQQTANKGKSVYLGGTALGIDMRVNGLIISGILPVVTASGVCTPLEGFGITKGDILESLNGDRKSVV